MYIFFLGDGVNQEQMQILRDLLSPAHTFLLMLNNLPRQRLHHNNQLIPRTKLQINILLYLIKLLNHSPQNSLFILNNFQLLLQYRDTCLHSFIFCNFIYYLLFQFQYFQFQFLGIFFTLFDVT